MCIVGELAGGGSVTVTVGINEMRHVTGDVQHMTHGIIFGIFLEVFL